MPTQVARLAAIVTVSPLLVPKRAVIEAALSQMPFCRAMSEARVVSFVQAGPLTSRGVPPL